VGECFFWYRPTQVVPDQRPLNGRCWDVKPQLGQRGVLTAEFSGSLCGIFRKMKSSAEQKMSTGEVKLVESRLGGGVLSVGESVFCI